MCYEFIDEKGRLRISNLVSCFTTGKQQLLAISSLVRRVGGFCSIIQPDRSNCNNGMEALVRSSSTVCCAALYCTVLHCTFQHNAVLFRTVLGVECTAVFLSPSGLFWLILAILCFQCWMSKIDFEINFQSLNTLWECDIVSSILPHTSLPGWLRRSISLLYCGLTACTVKIRDDIKSLN